MVVLVTNDDGVNSPGLLALKIAAEELGDMVVVVAPEREHSGVGKALSFRGRITRVRLPDGSEAYAVAGTPATCVLLAVHKLLGERPRLLLAGVNAGPNLGLEDVLNSGTVGAAVEAALHGIPAVAVSLVARSQWDYECMGVENYLPAARIAAALASYVLELGMPRGVDLFNVNVPASKPKGVVLTKLAWHCYGDVYRIRGEEYEIGEWHIERYRGNDGTDVEAIKAGYVSVTPISLEGLSTPTSGALNAYLERLRRVTLIT